MAQQPVHILDTHMIEGKTAAKNLYMVYFFKVQTPATQTCEQLIFVKSRTEWHQLILGQLLTSSSVIRLAE